MTVSRLQRPNLLRCRAKYRVLANQLASVPKRDFPWRITDNPYHILVAELLLQRTLPNHVVLIYKQIISRHPDACSLANACREEIANLVAPLGFRKRVDLILSAMQFICQAYGGYIPKGYENLSRVPAIGSYTASAIMNLIYSEPIAMVDVNTARIIVRTLNIEPKGDSPQKDKNIIAIADTIISCDKEHSREINLGFLDVGALYCRKNPKCEICPLKECCAYYRSHCNAKST